MNSTNQDREVTLRIDIPLILKEWPDFLKDIDVTDETERVINAENAGRFGLFSEMFRMGLIQVLQEAVGRVVHKEFVRRYKEEAIDKLREAGLGMEVDFRLIGPISLEEDDES
jgi:hypothetical protein